MCRPNSHPCPTRIPSPSVWLNLSLCLHRIYVSTNRKRYDRDRPKNARQAKMSMFGSEKLATMSWMSRLPRRGELVARRKRRRRGERERKRRREAGGDKSQQDMQFKYTILSARLLPILFELQRFHRPRDSIRRWISLGKEVVYQN